MGFCKVVKSLFWRSPRITTSRDIDPLIGSNEISDTYDELFAKSSLAWTSRWSESDIEIDGAPDDQSAVRYNIFQLITSCSARDSSVSIGARGLTHTRYKGCLFLGHGSLYVILFPVYPPRSCQELNGISRKNPSAGKRERQKDEQCRRSVSLDDIFRRF